MAPRIYMAIQLFRPGLRRSAELTVISPGRVLRCTDNAPRAAPTSGSTVAGMRNRHIRIRVEPLLFVARCAILIARHAKQRQHHDKTQSPAHETQHYPAEVHDSLNQGTSAAKDGAAQARREHNEPANVAAARNMTLC